MNLAPFNEFVTEHLFFGSLPVWQAAPLERLIVTGVDRNRSLEEIAYALATPYHETARFKFMEEVGEGAGRDYGNPVTLIRGSKVKYHGRGFAQLTWLQNYARMSVRLSLHYNQEINLVEDPHLAKDPEISAMILWEGMISGMFTGKALVDYFGPGRVDYVDARRIINGTDRANLIAGHARKFEQALRLIPEHTNWPSFRNPEAVA